MNRLYGIYKVAKVLLKNIKTECVYRTINRQNMANRVGAGFIHKSKYKDHQDSFVKAYSLVYVINGRGRYEDEYGNQYALAPGSIFQRIPNKKHSNWVQTNTQWLECFIELGQELYESLLKYQFFPVKSPVCTLGLDEVLIERFLKLKDSLKTCTDDDLQFQILDAIHILTFITKKVEQNEIGDKDQKMIEIACLWLRNSKNYNLPIELLCEENNWGYEKFRKLFKKKLGVSPGHYRIVRRMERACQYLQEKDKSIKKIAYLLGYPNAFDFSNQFKKMYKVSPKKFK